MKNGDLDNTPIPRIYIVFEGTIAKPRKEPSIGKRILARRHGLEVDEEVRVRLWNVWQRIGVRFDAVTFTHDPDDVQTFLDRENLPINTTWRFDSREEFIAGLPRMPWVHSVIDHERPLAYGGRGGSLDMVMR